jgi:hypothetical protein
LGPKRPDGHVATGKPRDRPRAVLLRMGSVQDKLAVLRGCKHLARNERFHRVGVNPSLTKAQLAAKAAAYPAARAARAEGKKAWFRDHVLYIDGVQQHTPSPLSHLAARAAQAPLSPLPPPPPPRHE